MNDFKLTPAPGAGGGFPLPFGDPSSLNMAPPLKNLIRSSRKARGLTQEDLAYLLGGRGGKLVSRYERFHREPKLRAALALEAALGRPVRELFPAPYAAALRTARRRARVMRMQLARRGAARSRQRLEAVRRILEGEPAE